MSVDIFKYHFALVTKAPNSFDQNPRIKDNNVINMDLIRRQQNEYTELFRRLGMDILELPPDERHTECAFVADMAVVINGTALICKPSSVDSRNRLGETSIVRTTLRNDLGLRIVEVDNEAACLEGTDVLFTGKEIIVGIGNYTNKEGAQCVAKAFPEYAVTIVRVPSGNIHLQQIMTMAGPDVIVVARGEKVQTCLQDMVMRMTFPYRIMRVDEEDAANVLYANGVILHLDPKLIPESFPYWESKFDNRLPVDYSEFMKAGGYLTSGVILVSKPSNYSKYFQTALEKGHHEL